MWRIATHCERLSIGGHLTWREMATKALRPPEDVRGMTILNREAFTTTIIAPCIRIRKQDSQSVLKLLKPQQLRLPNLRPYRPLTQPDNEQTAATAYNELLLHPEEVDGWESLPTAKLEQFNINKSDFYRSQIQLTYHNFPADQIFRSVLPEEEEGFSSYSLIGHIVHVNLRDSLLAYKTLIGQVLLDKVHGCRTVINKAQIIDNIYRNFEFELLCGEADYLVRTKENGIVYEFDFSRVYWNPRLSTEHARLVDKIRSIDTLYDVCAGVGPFSVPVARRGARVLANDLNPECVTWLERNAKLNKCGDRVKIFNKDARQFLREDVRTDLYQMWIKHCESTITPSEPTKSITHIVMNLPAMAVEFLDVFPGLLSDIDERIRLAAPTLRPPIVQVHVYMFVKPASADESAHNLVHRTIEQHLKAPMQPDRVESSFVRNVAPGKDMYRATVTLDFPLLIGEMVGTTCKDSSTAPPSPSAKRRKCDTEPPLPTEDSRSIET